MIDDDDELERLAEARVWAAGWREAARRALRLARLYRDEEGPNGARERAAVTQALEWRRAAREATAPAARPGLARTRPASAPGKRAAS